MNNLDLLKVYKFDKKIRLGAHGDGGYVIGELDGEYDCYISAGIANEESFSQQFINRYNMTEYNSFGFDGTVDRYPYQFTNKISFIRKNISNINNDTNSNLEWLMYMYDNIFLKMDIEAGEYPWILSLDEYKLKKFKQIVIEVHWICNDRDYPYSDKVKCLEKLAKTHYLIHAHGNNCGITVNKIPEVIELTYVNKAYFSIPPELNKVPLPVRGLDMPNERRNPDIDLNFPPFTNV